MSAGATGHTTSELLEEFRRELVDLRERQGSPGVRTMYERRRHEPNTEGTKDAFARLARGPMTEVPREELLRGFLLGLGIPREEAEPWEARRRQLLSDVQRLRPRDAAPADAVPAVVPGTPTPTVGPTAGGQPPPEAPDVAAPAQPDPPRWRRRTGWAVVGLALVLGGGAAVSTALTNEDDVAPDDLTVATGRVSCLSGAPVVGVYVDGGDGARGWASFHVEDDTSLASFTRAVHRDRPYEVHVGCGGEPDSWATDNRSDALTSTDVVLRCDDAQALTAGSHYGTCRGG